MKVYFLVQARQEYDIPDGLEELVMDAIKSGDIKSGDQLFDFCEGRGFECEWRWESESETFLSLPPEVREDGEEVIWRNPDESQQ